MAEFVVKIADDRGRIHQHVEQGYSEAEVRDRFSSQGYHVFWVKSQGMMAGGLGRRRRKLKQDTFLVFNQQFLT
jgi:type IV pilus assembly protein PilC